MFKVGDRVRVISASVEVGTLCVLRSGGVYTVERVYSNTNGDFLTVVGMPYSFDRSRFRPALVEYIKLCSAKETL